MEMAKHNKNEQNLPIGHYFILLIRKVTPDNSTCDAPKYCQECWLSKSVPHNWYILKQKPRQQFL